MRRAQIADEFPGVTEDRFIIDEGGVECHAIQALGHEASDGRIVTVGPGVCQRRVRR